MKWHDKLVLVLFAAVMMSVGAANVASAFIPGGLPEIFWWLWR
jgi:hypothetical protein